MKTPKPVLDRRRSIRITEKLPFKIGHDDYEAEAHTVNIGAHGVLCIVEREIALMTQLKIAITLPAISKASSKKKTLSIKGVVVRKEKDPAGQQWLIAVYFSEIKPEDQKFLQQFIESRLPSAE
jgi:c-di-GMP-binding flagellar brake protein YcgR